MKALLLNSGLGSRMGKLTENMTKCMCPIGNGYTIISWQLELLKRNGISEAIVTTGPFEELLKNHILQNGEGIHFTFINNPVYKDTNYIYSMYLARNYLDDDILLLHGDLVMEPSVIAELISAEKSVLTVDPSLPLPEKDFKAKIQAGKVSAVGIELFGEECVACQPAYKLRFPDVKVWLNEIEKFCLRGENKVYAENALNNITSEVNLFPVDLKRRLCSEIDNLEDLRVVSEKFQQLF